MCCWTRTRPRAPNRPKTISAIAGNNVGLGFGFTANEITSGGTTAFTFANPGAGEVASSTLGLCHGHSRRHPAPKTPIYPEIEAYYNLSSPDA